MYLTRIRRTEPTQESFVGLTRLHRLMDEVFGPWAGFTGELVSGWPPSCDVREDKEHLTITMEVPGVRPEELKISLENQVLTVRGEKQQLEEQKDERWHRFERAFGTFERSFTLPSTVDADRIEANLNNGVLAIRLPKVEKARPREISVRSGS